MLRPGEIDSAEAGKLWDRQADAWTELVRAGFDYYRDCINTPGFFSILPDVAGLKGLDIGCGEGHNTRLLAKAGAKMTAIDISERFILHARNKENDSPMGIAYITASALELPFGNNSFDFCTAFMSLMDMPETDVVFREVVRVLKPGGFFQFSILHPCFIPPYRKDLKDEQGRARAAEVGGYFDGEKCSIEEWMFRGVPENRGVDNFRHPYYHRTLSEWMNLAADTGFSLERCNEPFPDDDVLKQYPFLENSRITAFFLQLCFRKNEGKIK